MSDRTDRPSGVDAPEPGAHADSLPAQDNAPAARTGKRRRRRPVHRLPWLLTGMVLGALLLAVIQSYTGLGLPQWAARAQAGLAPVVQGGQTPAALAGGAAANPAAAGDARKLEIREANARGPANAPIVVIEYSDFQCPFCRRFFSETQPQIDANYVKAGQVRFVYKHLAILGQESLWAAEAAECAADQGQFWLFHDELFRQAGLSGGENVGAFTKEKLSTYAQSLGLDMTRFEPCLQNDTTQARVAKDTQEARGFGFGGTPSFLINTSTLIGAQPYAAFARLVDAGLGIQR
jgi:protein-disulfide isomerase